MKKANIKIDQDWLRLVIKLAALIIVLYLIFGVLVGLQRVEGVSMSNRVEDGDLVLFSRTDRAYYSDDVVLFERNQEIHVSSIIAFPGDLIELDEIGRLYVNSVQVSDAVVYDLGQGDRPSISFPFRVPLEQYFVLNENLDSDDDSRSFGAISEKDIKGKVVGILRTRAI